MELIVNAKFEVVRTEGNKDYHHLFFPIEERIVSKSCDTAEECYRDIHQKCMDECEYLSTVPENEAPSTIRYEYSWCDEKFVNNNKEIR